MILGQKSAGGVHTIERSVANKNKTLRTKNKTKTARKFFSTVIASQLSAYEEDRINKGLPVGGWVHSCKKDVKEAIKRGCNKPIKRKTTFRDNSVQVFEISPDKYGYLENGEVKIYPHQKRFIRLGNCGKLIQKLVDVKDPTNVFYGDKNHGCNDKLCVECARIQSYTALLKYSDSIKEEIEEPVMLVLHYTSPKIGDLKDSLAKQYNDLTLMRKQNSKDAKKDECEKWSYFWSFEITMNDKNRSYHPHWHIITERRYAQDILDKWIDRKNPSEELREKMVYAHKGAISEPLIGQKDKEGNEITLEQQLLEQVKYVAKLSIDVIGEDGNVNLNEDGKPIKRSAPIDMLYEMLMCTYRRRRWGAAGKLYNKFTTKEVKQKIKEDIQQRVKDESFNINDNWILGLSDVWVFNYKKHDYIGQCKGAEMKLTRYEPSKATLDYLGISDNFKVEKDYVDDDSVNEGAEMKLTRYEPNKATSDNLKVMKDVRVKILKDYVDDDLVKYNSNNFLKRKLKKDFYRHDLLKHRHGLNYLDLDLKELHEVEHDLLKHRLTPD